MLRQKPLVSLLAIVFFVLIVTQLGFPLSSQLASIKTWTYPDGYDPHGGYLDKVTFVVYPPRDEQIGLQALQANIIYAWDERVPAENIAELQATAGVEVSSELADACLVLVLNCSKFPMNITGYRRAIAFALNKSAVVEVSNLGLGYPQDCALPRILGNWTYDPQLVETYLTQDIVKANASLSAAGFRDLTGDGWRDFDFNNNSIWEPGIDLDSFEFNISLYHREWNTDSGNILTLAADGLHRCGIRVDVISLRSWEIQNQFSNYWLKCSYLRNLASPAVLYELFHSSSSYNQAYIGGWNNPTYDQYAENLMASQTEEDANDWAWTCQELLWFEQPLIVCYNDVYTHAYRTEIWEGYINMRHRNRIANGYSLVHIRLKEEAGGPWGRYPVEYIMSLNEGLDTTNWLMSNSSHSTKVFQLVYEGLWTVSPYDLTPQPSLAYAWETESTIASGDIQDGEKYTFHLYENATWHDGLPVTASDVAYSVTLGLLNPNSAELFHHIYRVNIVNGHTIEIFSNATGYFEWERATGFTVYPAHIWSTHPNITLWQPSVEELVGSGPYVFLAHVPGQYVVLERHHAWHFAVEMPLRPNWWDPPPGYYLLIMIGIIVIIIQVVILGYLLWRRRESKAKYKPPYRS